MKSLRILLFFASSTLSIVSAHSSPLPPPVSAKSIDDARLKRLFHDSNEAALKRNPLDALFRGDLRYANRLDRFLSDKYDNDDRKANIAEYRVLRTINRNNLDAVNQIAYDVFENDRKTELKGYSREIYRIKRDLPLNHFSGLHVFYPHLASGEGAAPFKTALDYRNNLKRNAEYARILDRAIVRFKLGMNDRVVEPKIVVRDMVDQFNALIDEGVSGSNFYKPVINMPPSIPPNAQTRLRRAYTSQIRNVVIPAETRIRDFLLKDYLPVARDTVGLSAMPDGDKYYAYLIEKETTLPISPIEVHQIGLNEVARITGQIQAQQKVVGFKGSLTQFYNFLRTDERFQARSSEQLRIGYQAIEKRVYERISEQFAVTPTSQPDIREMPSSMSRSGPNGMYAQGTADGSRQGVFYYNANNLSSRYSWQMQTLFLHEGVPGHHFQISLAQQNGSLPDFMRFGGNTAYVEGWALYAEGLWNELGMETDPYDRLGGLNDELQRALRLVVDSGIHSQGWSRDEAIDYMLANSPMARTSATAEVDRYIAIPGQALAYKIGQLTILAEKNKAMKALGSQFDPRAFHTQILNTGALPMPVLQRKIDAWIKASGA